jgi:hypothetical protein
LLTDPSRLSTGMLITHVEADASASELALELADRLRMQAYEISLLQADLAAERSARLAIEGRLVLVSMAARNSVQRLISA